MKNYWCFRIDKTKKEFFFSELLNGKLRQGWGWDIKQDLRNLQMDQGAKRNLPMFKKVKKGDIILVPGIPKIDDVSLVEATENWNEGYLFEISEKHNDYGHIFPAKYIKSFKRFSKTSSGQIRATLKNIQRFWNINSLATDVKNLLEASETEIQKEINHESRFKNTIETVYYTMFNEKLFSKTLFEQLNKEFTNEEWEYAILYGLREMFPNYMGSFEKMSTAIIESDLELRDENSHRNINDDFRHKTDLPFVRLFSLLYKKIHLWPYRRCN
jgi:hypothetical protein